MAHYLSNHIAVAYGDIFADMVELSRRLGFRVRVLDGCCCRLLVAEFVFSTPATA